MLVATALIKSLTLTMASSFPQASHALCRLAVDEPGRRVAANI
jgi:hypothetical protein